MTNPSSLPILNSPAAIMAALIYQPSGAIFTDPLLNLPWPIYVNSMPDVVDDCAQVNDVTGIMDKRTLNGQEICDYGIQIFGRSTNVGLIYTKLATLTRQFQDVKRFQITVDGNVYKIDTIKRTANIIRLGDDERRRSMVSVNFLLGLIG